MKHALAIIAQGRGKYKPGPPGGRASLLWPELPGLAACGNLEVAKHPDGGGGVLEDITELEAERTSLYQELSQTGDLRRGTITATYRRCGKANCACANPEHPGHGPRYMLTRTMAGKTRAIHLRLGPELRKAEREIENYYKFNSLVHRNVDLNEKILYRPAT